MSATEETAVTNTMFDNVSDNSGTDQAASAFDKALDLKEAEPSQPRPQRAPTSEPSKTPIGDIFPSEKAPSASPPASDDPNDDDDPDALTPEGEGEEGEQAEDDDPEFEIPVAGKTEKVKLSKLREDYGKGADYTQKTQALAKDKELLYSYAEEAKAEREAFKARAMELDAMAKALEPSPEDWAALRQMDPKQYADAKDNWANILKKRDEVLAQVKKTEEADNKDAGLRYSQWVNEENAKVRNALPVIFDSKKGPNVRDRIFKYGESVGYTKEQLMQAVDHREVVTLYKAMRFDEIQAAKANGQIPMPVQNKPRPQMSNGKAPNISTSRAPSARTNIAKAQDVLSRTGKIEDAALAFTEILKS